MAWWTLWTNLLQHALGFLTAHLGGSEALAIILLTVLARLALLPLSLKAALRSQRNKEALERLQPELDALKEACKDDQAELGRRTMALYREHRISFLDRISVLNMASQSIFGLGFFQALRRSVLKSRFLWISTLAKPDFLLTLLVGALMLAGMSLVPGATANTSMVIMLVVSVVVSIFAIAALPSAIGLYWATSNAITVVQSVVLRSLLAKPKQLTA
jgi:YidC/Oxa1 family membrane protein insertase